MSEAGRIHDRLSAALADRYRIERELGQGGMATVYLAEDLRHHRKVAVKVLRPELAATLGPERFFREIEVAAQLQHPHILPLHDSGEAGGFLYYVMPFVEGESLRDRLTRQGELPVHEAVRLLAEVADALACAHRQGVVHRDIKPENILLSGRHALVADFGVAKAVSEATGRQQLTTAGVALGTPAYMAPEQAAADPHVDHRVDIYALGVLGYELLAGRTPFAGKTPQETLAAHLMQPPDPVTRHRATVPPMLESVIMKCLAKRPADRFEKADDLVIALESLATPSGGITPTGTRPIEAAGQRPARWPFVAIGAAVLLALVFTGWVVSRRPRPPTPVADTTSSVAVLPFTELGAPAGQDYFADGLTDEVITALSKVPGLRVPGRGSAFYFKGTTASLRAIADSLHVHSLLTATVQRAEGRVRVRAQLISATDGFQLWAETYDRPVRDLFAVYDDVARGISGALRVKLGAAPAASSRPQVDPAAYDAFLIAGKYLADRQIDSALTFLRAAVKADSTFTAAWASLALANVLSTPAQYRVPGVSGKEGLRRAREALDHALSQDSLSLEAHVAAGFIAFQEFRWQDSEREYAFAIRLNPNSSQAHHYHAILLAVLGKGTEALAEERLAETLDPLAVIVGDWVGLMTWSFGQHEAALRQFDRLRALHPRSRRIWEDAALLYLRAGDYARSADLYQQAVMIAHGDSALARRWGTGIRDSATRAKTGAEIADSIFRGSADVLAYTGDIAAARRFLARQPTGPGEFGIMDGMWVTHPELLRSPEFQRMMAQLKASLRP
jgi:eukaryotic-like serine/threonine-protein kinase